MELAVKPPRSNFMSGLWEATAFLGPILLFGYGSLSRVIAFFNTHSLATLVSAAGFIALTSVLVVRRPPREVDRSFISLFAAFSGNFLTFLYILDNPTDFAGPVPLIIPVTATVLGIWMVMSLRLSMGITPANRGIKIGGPYRFVRHPLYVCVILSQVGLLLEYPSAFNRLILALGVCFKAWMIVNEERILRRDPEYVAYAARVRYRAIPGVV